MFGFLAKVFKTDLLDPLDIQPNLIKTVVRIWDEIYHYLKTDVNLVEEACSQSLLEIFNFCIPDKDDKLLINSIFYKPLAGIIASGGDKLAQEKSAFILNKFMEYLILEDYFDLANFFAPKIVALYTKSSWISPEFTNWVNLVLKNLGIKFFLSVLNEIIFKETEILQSDQKQYYKEKIASWEFLTELGKLLGLINFSDYWFL